MPLSIFDRLKVGEIKPTGMTLQLADRSVTYPTGIVEDVLVKIDKFVFPVDFVVLEMEEDNNVPFILGRPFLATARAIVDMSTGKLTLKLNEEELTFDTYKAMRHPSEEEECKRIDVIDSCVEENLQNSLNPYFSSIIDNPLFEFDVESHDFMNDCDVRIEEEPEEAKQVWGRKPQFLSLREPVVGGEEPERKKEGLKPLPNHLKYTFLEEGEKFPVIVSSSLRMLSCMTSYVFLGSINLL
ncbi:hypothetical protein ACS0TY_021293 [Phlomoides rotata]